MTSTIKLTRGGAAAARVAHNHEVTGSSPVPATKIRTRRKSGFCFVLSYIRAKKVRSLVCCPSILGAQINVRCPVLATKPPNLFLN